MSSVAFITGTRKGLGRALAEHLLQAGWKVNGCSREPADWSHPAYEHHLADVSDEAAVVRTVRAIARAHGRIDALINNAGIASMNALALSPASAARRLTDVNFLGAFYCLRETAKIMMRQKSGRIINFSSVAVPLDLEGEALYAATKAAVESLTRVSARELAPYGITVNAIGPNPILTDLTRTVPRAKLDALVARQAIPRLGEPRDVLNVVDFFLRPASDFITGQIIYLGGVHG
jgi:3-oxoacyl-[acyl-carrier protein] reductase